MIEEHLESFGPFDPDDLLFVDSRTGSTPTITAWRRVWKNARDAVGVDYTFHDLRHLADAHGAAIRFSRTKASQEHAVVPIARNSTSRWCPVTILESWLDELPTVADQFRHGLPWITKGDAYRAGLPPIGPAAIDGIITRRIKAAGLANPASYSPHSLRAGFITEARTAAPTKPTSCATPDSNRCASWAPTTANPAGGCATRQQR